MNKRILEFIADNFSFERLSKKTIRTKIPDNKYVILACDTQYNSTELFLEFILSPAIKNQKSNKVADYHQEYMCSNCHEYIEEEYFENDYGDSLCRRCFECMRDALIIKKENVTFVYINDEPSSPIYIMREGVSEHIYVSIISTFPLNGNIKTGHGHNQNFCIYCKKLRQYSMKKCKFNMYDYIEKCDNKRSYITICKKCLKFREYASFMNNYCFVYINEIFTTNYLLPELKKLIAEYMLEIAAY
jgi:hypothetical protein